MEVRALTDAIITAELLGSKLATRDHERFRLYFPNVELILPSVA